MALAKVPQHFERTIWLTPGPVTGWASLGSDMAFSSGQTDFLTLGNELESYARFHHNQLAIGYEALAFPIDEAGAEVIGMVKWVTYKYNVTLLTPATSDLRIAVLDGNEIGKLKWDKPGREWANAAADHLLAWLLREGRTPMHLAVELSL